MEILKFIAGAIPLKQKEAFPKPEFKPASAVWFSGTG